MADNLNYFSNEEESEWLASIDPSLLDKSNEEKQLDEGEISSFIEENRNSNTTKKTKTDLKCLDSVVQLQQREKANGGYSSRGTEQSPCPFFYQSQKAQRR